IPAASRSSARGHPPSPPAAFSCPLSFAFLCVPCAPGVSVVDFFLSPSALQPSEHLFSQAAHPYTMSLCGWGPAGDVRSGAREVMKINSVNRIIYFASLGAAAILFPALLFAQAPP